MTATIIIGHVIDALRILPDESVHMVCTSPPYWSLRNYGLEPQVWGGDAKCAHEWDERRWYTERSASGASAEAFSEPGEANADRLRKARWRTDAICSKCDAWRGEHGLEPTIALYLRHVLLWTREVKRVLRADGTFWLNISDCYYSGDRGGYQNERTRNDSLQRSNLASDFIGAPNRMPQEGLKDKDLVQMPARVSLMLQEDGWWVRSKIVWAKGISFLPGYSGSVMPESIGDRPTRAYEEIFLLAKSPDYFADMDAVREPLAESSIARISQPTFDGQTGGGKDYGTSGVNRNRSARKALENLRARVGRYEEAEGLRLQSRTRMRRDAGREEQGLRTSEKFGHGPGWRDKTALTPPVDGRRQAPEPGEPNAFHPLGRNVRDVWVINPEPFDYEMCQACKRVYDSGEFALLPFEPEPPEDRPPRRVCRCGRWDAWVSHFATFAQALVLPMILAGTSERGCYSQCGAPWERLVEADGGTIGQAWHDHKDDFVRGHRAESDGKSRDGSYRRVEKGWRPTCRCRQAFCTKCGFALELPGNVPKVRPRVSGQGQCPICGSTLEQRTPTSAAATVLDPFCGSGTSLLVAAKNGRNSIGIELQEDYVPLIEARLRPFAFDLVHPTEIRVERAGDRVG